MRIFHPLLSILLFLYFFLYYSMLLEFRMRAWYILSTCTRRCIHSTHASESEGERNSSMTSPGPRGSQWLSSVLKFCAGFLCYYRTDFVGRTRHRVFVLLASFLIKLEPTAIRSSKTFVRVSFWRSLRGTCTKPTNGASSKFYPLIIHSWYLADGNSSCRANGMTGKALCYWNGEVSSIRPCV